MSDYRLPPWIPEDVSDAMKAAAENRMNGRVEVQYNEGEPMAVNAFQSKKIRKRSAAGPVCPAPGCGARMSSYDYQNSWLCTRPGCNTKRTRTQLRSQGIAV